MHWITKVFFVSMAIAIIVSVAIFMARLDAVMDRTTNAQECVIRLLLKDPENRAGYTVDSIMDNCPDALSAPDEGPTSDDDTEASLPKWPPWG